MKILSIYLLIYVLLLLVLLIESIGGCSAGQYPVGTVNPTCQPCRVGHYCTENGDHINDQLCPTGTYTPNIGASSVDSCLKCPGCWVLRVRLI